MRIRFFPPDPAQLKLKTGSDLNLKTNIYIKLDYVNMIKRIKRKRYISQNSQMYKSYYMKRVWF